jgi:hypothetical protein
MKMTGLWDSAPCGLVETDWGLGRNYRLHHLASESVIAVMNFAPEGGGFGKILSLSLSLSLSIYIYIYIYICVCEFFHDLSIKATPLLSEVEN